MARKVQQFRYYQEPDPNNTDSNKQLNYPSDELMTKDNLINNNIFEKFPNIKQIGIQSMPGVQFKINSENMDNWVVIGLTGIYELDLEDLIDIHSIQFHEDSVTMVSSNETGYIIIDILYDEEDEK